MSGALIDQFTTSNAIVRELQGRFPGCHISQQPKAESDLAVAYASVLARAQFLHTMDTLALLAGEDALPKGQCFGNGGRWTYSFKDRKGGAPNFVVAFCQLPKNIENKV